MESHGVTQENAVRTCTYMVRIHVWCHIGGPEVVGGIPYLRYVHMYLSQCVHEVGGTLSTSTLKFTRGRDRVAHTCTCTCTCI